MRSRTDSSEGEERGASSSQNGYDRVWMERYGELVEFYNRNGDCAVPSDYEPNRKLGNWVRSQRAQYKPFREGAPCTMTVERVELLDQLNFQWRVKCDWMKQYRELEDYYNYHGDSRIPTNWPNNRSLGRWVDRQRTAYRRHMAGNRSTMTKERIKMLEQLDFRWKVRDDWFERYDELVIYFRKNGDSLVPSKYPQNPGLAKWVDTRKSFLRPLAGCDSWNDDI